MPSRPTTFSNRILSRLSAIDFALLEPHLIAVDLPLRKQLEAPLKPINYIYFIESGYASVVADGTGKRGIEVGLIGREGMTGLAVVMAPDRTHHETFNQCAGGVADQCAETAQCDGEKQRPAEPTPALWSRLSHANDLHRNGKCK